MRLPLIAMLLLTTFWISAGANPLAGLNPAQQQTTRARFDYDHTTVPKLTQLSSSLKGGIQIRDVEFAATGSGRAHVKVYVITPQARGEVAARKYAGILYFHWLGEANSNRQEFFEEAGAMAKRGVVAVLIEGYFPWKLPPKDGATDLRRVIEETIDLRRALDLLLAQPGVDPQSLAFVGHDYGAMYGSILAGVDQRPQSYVLLAPTGSFSRWSLDYWLAKTTPQLKNAYRDALSAIDPIKQISQLAAPAQMLLQFATHDEHIRREEAEAFAAAVGVPKQVKWYDAKHDLRIEKADQDRRAWLSKRLGLK